MTAWELGEVSIVRGQSDHYHLFQGVQWPVLLILIGTAPIIIYYSGHRGHYYSFQWTLLFFWGEQCLGHF